MALISAMTQFSDEEIQRRFSRFMSKNAADSNSYLERFRPAIIEFHLHGYSRAAMFRTFTGDQRIACSRSTFYKWIDANVDLKKRLGNF